MDKYAASNGKAERTCQTLTRHNHRKLPEEQARRVRTRYHCHIPADPEPPQFIHHGTHILQLHGITVTFQLTLNHHSSFIMAHILQLLF